MVRLAITVTCEYDTILSTGEQITVGLLALALQDIGIPARSWLGWQIPIHTDDTHTKASILTIESAQLEDHLSRGEVPVIAGFQGISSRRTRITTLGRGGSDTTAVALAAST